MQHLCPHHAHALTRYPVQGHVTWRCDRCAGVWVPGSVVRDVVTAPHWPNADTMRATSLHCPDDAQALKVFHARGIELDCCTRCHGVWLDQGELERIGAQAQHDDADEPGGDWREDAADGAIDLLDEVSSRVSSSKATATEPPALPMRVPDVAGKRFDVELDIPPPLPSATSTSALLETEAAGAAIDAIGTDAGMLEAAADLTGEAVGAALELIGNIFSAL